MKTIPGISMRAGIDRPTNIRCMACDRTAYVLPAGNRLVKAPQGEEKSVTCQCGAVLHLRVLVGVEHG